RAVAKRLHELVVEELLVFGLVGVADDDFVDVGLSELLRLDLVLLRSTQEIVEEGDVELEDLDELDDAAVRDVELAIEIEGPRIRVGTFLGVLSIVDVPGELGRFLVLFVLRLESTDADAVLFAEPHAAHADVLHDLRPITAVLVHQLVEDETTSRIEIAI